MSTATQPLTRNMVRLDASQVRDARLLKRFAQCQDEAAFALLMRLHGPLVFGVCRRVLGNHHDAEEAFQATFLVLARKAPSLTRPERLANWLHGVAHRTASKAKVLRAKERTRETSLMALPEVAAARTDRWMELAPLIDDELSRLSDHYRLPLVLCDLQGHTRKSAARQIGCPESTLVSRLLKGRTMLAARLTRRGVALSTGGLLVLLSQNPTSAAPPEIAIDAVTRAARLPGAQAAAREGIVSYRVASLTDCVLRSLLGISVKTLVAALVLIVGLGSGSALVAGVSTGKTPLSMLTGMLSNRRVAPVAVVKPHVSLVADVVQKQKEMCVWVNPRDASQSTIISASAQANSICVYDLAGNVLQRIEAPQPESIDIRQNVQLNGKQFDLVVLNQCTEPCAIQVFRVDLETRLLHRMDHGQLLTGYSSGGCLYRSRRTGTLYFICTSQQGIVEQYELYGSGGAGVAHRLVRSWPVRQSEGAVADDDTGEVFIVEEDVGIWKFSAEPDDNASGELIARVGEEGFRGDAEGLTIARGSDGSGFLIVSDQGESQFRLYDRKTPHTYRGKFAVQGAQRTHGIEACAVDLGPNFPGGVFICQSNKAPWPLLVTPLRSIVEQFEASR